MTRKERRHERRRLGLCTECGKPAEIGKSKCKICSQIHNAASKKTSIRYKNEKKCVCGRPRALNSINCVVCKESKKQSAIKLRKKRKENGLCIRCGKPLLERTDVTKCNNCLDSSFEFRW